MTPGSGCRPASPALRSWSWWCVTTTPGRRHRCGSAARRRAERRRRAGPARRDTFGRLRPPGHRLGAQGRPDPHRARPPRPRAGRGDGGAARRAGRSAPRRWPGSAARVGELLAEIQDALFADATRRREPPTAEVTTVDEAIEAAETGFARIPCRAVGTGGRGPLGAVGHHRPLPADRGGWCPGDRRRAGPRRVSSVAATESGVADPGQPSAGRVAASGYTRTSDDSVP